MRFLVTVIIIVIVYNIIKYLAGYAIRNFMKKNMGGAQQQQQYKRKPEGQVTIKDNGQSKKNKISKDEGDYIDFEEVKE